MSTGAVPWAALYPPGISLEPPALADQQSLVTAWRNRVSNRPMRSAIRYFDGSLSAAEVDAWSDALAVEFQRRGVSLGDRIAVRLQNVPQFAITMLAAWKTGAAVVLVNPMYRRRELRHLVDDAEVCAIVTDDSDADDVSETARDSSVRWMLSTSGREFQSRSDPRVFAPGARTALPNGVDDWTDATSPHLGEHPRPVQVSPGDLALLTYTSGTTGAPKGAENSHRNVLTAAANFGAWVDLGPGDVVLGIAPLFHITGAVINATMALIHDTTLSLANRFHPSVILETLHEHKVTFTIGSITAFNALAADPSATREHFAHVKLLYSGGAPIPPATVERFEARFGHYIHNVYGMTETASAVIAVPRGSTAPLDRSSNTLSVGVPLPGLMARIVAADGSEMEPGDQGELELTGLSVAAGYWRNQEATERTMPGGRLRTGDGAIMDSDGWVYLVDRLKDQINVSGFKVWPREVEDALYEHAAVHESAVVGKPDPYRGETVVAFVSLEAGHVVDEAELVGFLRERLAAYKCPSQIIIVDDLPKTQTGKIRRKELRDELLPRTDGSAGAPHDA
ncbi:class I adenylate-forming enzyme family protein [Nocardia vinacea]|uniref:class I adenylate-forming enzyme family protein n=1 Tax=Nocardia vinacea TaxID=96468 RepID=UPI0006869B95|nr:AMP-binding protein [Nocardia vinacea]